MDWTYINTLLNIIHQASTAGPKFAGIAAKADEELTAYMAAPVEVVEDDESEEPTDE